MTWTWFSCAWRHTVKKKNTKQAKGWVTDSLKVVPRDEKKLLRIRSQLELHLEMTHDHSYCVGLLLQRAFNYPFLVL